MKFEPIRTASGPSRRVFETTPPRWRQRDVTPPRRHRRDPTSVDACRDGVRAAQVNLGALNERWVKIEFLCDFYKGTDVPLLKFGAISASRGSEEVLRHRRDSCSSHDAGGGLFFDFGAIRTASGPSRRVRGTAVASMASARDSAAATPSTRCHIGPRLETAMLRAGAQHLPVRRARRDL